MYKGITKTELGFGSWQFSPSKPELFVLFHWNVAYGYFYNWCVYFFPFVSKDFVLDSLRLLHVIYSPNASVWKMLQMYKNLVCYIYHNITPLLNVSMCLLWFIKSTFSPLESGMSMLPLYAHALTPSSLLHLLNSAIAWTLSLWNSSADPDPLCR